MSRTYRRKNGDPQELDWVLTKTEWTWRYWADGSMWREWRKIHIDPKSPEGKKALNRYHSDGSKAYWRGPMWFHKEYAQVPYRVRAKNEIHKYMRNPDYEVIIEDKPHREYWT
jgi:hypothetical protein